MGWLGLILGLGLFLFLELILFLDLILFLGEHRDAFPQFCRILHTERTALLCDRQKGDHQVEGGVDTVYGNIYEQRLGGLWVGGGVICER
jgi:hypothetical protein